jgi:tRNA threonylcarbamoyl adenosine modification protein YeaZ
MLILAADTSLPILSVALTDGAALIAAVALEGRKSRTEKLLPAIDWILAEQSVDRQAIELFAITRGPGSFTGVRIGLATFQALALALGRPVCSIPTHEALAFHGEDLEFSFVHDDAGRGEFYGSTFAPDRSDPARLLTRAELLSAIAGNRSTSVAAFMADRNVAVRTALRAAAIARSDRLSSYRDATPIYVRLAEAEVKLAQKKDD